MNNFYTESINSAIKYIEENLDKKINYNDIASAAGMSNYHFYRLFPALTGESVYDTIIRLKAEKAAKLLLNNKSISVSELAKNVGFNNPKSLSNAFKNRFSKSPSAWRKEISNNPGKTSFTDYPLFKESDKAETKTIAVSSRIEKVEGFSMAFVNHPGAYSGDTALFMYLYNKLSIWAGSKDLLGSEYENIVLYHEPAVISDEMKLKISLGVSVPENTETDGDIGILNISGGNYLICRYLLQEEDYDSAWSDVYRTWLPHHKLMPVDGYCFEMYPSAEKSEDKQSSVVDICVPVKELR